MPETDISQGAIVLAEPQSLNNAPGVIDLFIKANEQHEQSRLDFNSAVHAARRAGEYLLEAKSLCQHGEWIRQIEVYFDGSPRQARRYMRLAKHWEEIEAAAKRTQASLLPEENKGFDSRFQVGNLTIDGALKLLSHDSAIDVPYVEVEEVEGELIEECAKGDADSATPTKAKSPVPMPSGEYGCLVIDPPWAYELRTDDASHRNKIPYLSMTTQEICDLPVRELCPQGVLWLWTTNNHLPEAMQALERWDFDLKTMLTWVKVAKNGETRMGVGHWLRASTEHCILAVRGRVPSFAAQMVLKNETTVIFAERREHSRKPDEFYEMVERLCPGMTKLEMFARQVRPGWEAWGNETDLFSDEVTP